MTLKKTFGQIALMVLTVTGLWSCSSSSDNLTSVIPGNSDIIIKVNAIDILNGMGFNEKDNSWNTAGNRDIDEVKEAITILNECIDLSEVYRFGYDNRMYTIAAIKDKSKLEEQLKAHCTATEEGNGAEWYVTKKNWYIGVDGDIIWATENTPNVEDVKSAAKAHKMSEFGARMEWLTSDNTISVAGNASVLGVPSIMGEKWVCGRFNIKGNEGEGELCLIDSEGERWSFGSMLADPVDPYFLTYTPEGSTFTMAIGAPSAAIKMLLGSYLGSINENIAAFVGQIDGTIGLSVKFDPEDVAEAGNLEDIEGLLMIKASQQGVNDMVTEITDNARLMGQAPEKNNSGLYSCIINGTEAYYGNVNGNLVFSSYPLSGVFQNELAPDFEGCRAALVLRASSNLTLKAKLTDDALHCRLIMNSMDKPYLLQLMDELTNTEWSDILYTGFVEEPIDDTFGGYDDDDNFFVNVDDELDNYYDE